jgi:hypothetical protein
MMVEGSVARPEVSPETAILLCNCHENNLGFTGWQRGEHASGTLQVILPRTPTT